MELSRSLADLVPGVLGSCKGGEGLTEKFIATIRFASISTLGHFLACSEDVAASLVTPIAPEGESLLNILDRIKIKEVTEHCRLSMRLPS